MAQAIMFDTLYYANKLKAAGVPARQAEVQAETLGEIFEESEQRLATKADLEDLRKDMLIKFAEQKTEMIKWGIGISVGQAALIISMLKFFH